jgi:hypothetical protein
MNSSTSFEFIIPKLSQSKCSCPVRERQSHLAYKDEYHAHLQK